MAAGQLTRQVRSFRIAVCDPRLALVLQSIGLLWASSWSTLVGRDFLGNLWLEALVTYGPCFCLQFLLISSRSLTLSSDVVTFGENRKAQTLSLEGLRVEQDQARRAMVFIPLTGSQVKVHPFSIKDANRLVEALEAAGIEVLPKEDRLDGLTPHDFELDSPLTDSVNWRWQGCKTPDLALDAVIGSSDTQKVKVKEGRLSLIRKGREVASFDVKDLTLVRQYKQAEPETVRLVLKVGSRDLWPLSDWNSPVGTKLFAALTAQGVPVEEQAWVRRQEALTW